MDRQAARIADIGHVVEHLQRFDEALAGFLVEIKEVIGDAMSQQLLPI